jgi:hypothetical protein
VEQSKSQTLLSILWGEERVKILLLACCYQEESDARMRRWTRARPLRRNASLAGAGRNAASGRNVGHVRANGAATVLHRWFPWVALTKGRAMACTPSALLTFF